MTRWSEAHTLHQEGMNGAAIAVRLGVTRQRVHQLLNSPEPSSQRESERERIQRLGRALLAIEQTRERLDRAAGVAFLPEGWAALARSIRPLLDVAEVAHELVYSTTHTNLTGPEYAERKAMYDKLRRFLDRLP